MVIPKLFFRNGIMLFLFLNLFILSVYSQVGIGNTNPNTSAILDITSETQGMLTPRMTTAQRLAISNPANGLMVYDLDARTIYFYDANVTAWESLNTSKEKRNNFVLVKSLADFPAPVGSVITLQTNTYYEINGVISLAGNSINLNNASVSGLDAYEDIIVAGAGTTAFQGSTGGSVKNITITGGGTAFNITASTTAENFLFQNSIVANMTSVGSISGLGLYFSNIVQFVGNGGGITYSNIGNLLLSNQAWLEGNGGSYETFTGTFALIGKVSGFSTVGAGATGINVSSNPTVGEGVLLTTMFTGAGTYVNKYTTGSYPGFNFNNNWVVNSPGIPRESDDEASANIYYTGNITTGFVQTVTNNTAFNLTGNSGSNTTAAVNLFRASSPQNNRITYKGSKTKTFQISASLSVRESSLVGNYYGFLIVKNGSIVLTETNSVMRVNNTSDINSLAISGTVELSSDDYIEIWGQRLVGSGSTTLAVFSLNVNVN